MNTVEITIISIFLMIGIGYFLKRIDFLSENDIEALNKIVMYVCLPCMIFSALYSTNMGLLPVLGVLPFIILIESAICGIIAFVILKSLHCDDKTMWSVLLPLLISNTAFVGYPVTLGVYGNQGFVMAVFCDLATTVIFLILSFILVLKFGGTIKNAFKKILLFPPLWAVVLGILFNLFNIPVNPVIDKSINYLADGAIPLIMISLGLAINFKGFSRNKSLVGINSAIKLILCPIVTLAIVSYLGFSGLQHDVGIIEAAMPSGTMSLVLAISYKLDYELTSDCILVNAIISLLSLPILIFLI